MYLFMAIGFLALFSLILLLKIKKDSEILKNFKAENDKFKEKYSGIINEEQIIEVKKKELEEVLENLTKEKNETLKLVKTKSNLQFLIKNLEETLELQSFGLYKPKYFYETSEDYKERLDEIYNQQKQMIKNKTAALCSTEWTVEGSKAKGRKMTNNNLKMILRAFNGEADAAIAKVKYNNINVMEKRIYNAQNNINNLSSANHCRLNEIYVDLKLEELYLNHEYAQKLQDEKEEQRLIREQMREEEKAQKEYEKAIKDAELEERKYQKALEQTKREYEKIMATKSEEERAKFSERIAQLEKELDEAKSLKERAISQAQLTRSGHVYIISNIGSFGEDIYKIGMTRRLEPEERVRELSGASVPFPFDIHAMIYSKDAPGLETLLHRTFNDKRVNLINQKREFFNISLEEIERFVLENHGEFKLTKHAEADQFRQTLSLKNNNEQPEFNPQDELDIELEELGLIA